MTNPNLRNRFRYCTYLRVLNTVNRNWLVLVSNVRSPCNYYLINRTTGYLTCGTLPRQEPLALAVAENRTVRHHINVDFIPWAPVLAGGTFCGLVVFCSPPFPPFKCGLTDGSRLVDWLRWGLVAVWEWKPQIAPDFRGLARFSTPLSLSLASRLWTPEMVVWSLVVWSSGSLYHMWTLKGLVV